MYIHAGSIFLLPRFLSFSSFNFRRVVYLQILDFFSFWNLTIYRKMDRPRTIQPLWESLYFRAVFFSVSDFTFGTHSPSRSRARVSCGPTYFASRSRWPSCSTGIDSRRGYIWLNISFVCILFYIFVPLPFWFILLIDLSRWEKGSDERRGRLKGATQRTYFGYRERFSEETKKQALRKKMWKNKLGKWKKFRSQMKNRFVKWARFWGNEEIENRLSRTKGKVF